MPVPLLSERDEEESSEGGIDPLGLYTIADNLAVRLVPGVRERQRFPRFLTAMAVSLAVCEEFGDDSVAADGVSEPWLVFEWYVVEGLVRRLLSEDRVGLPGSGKAAEAVRDGVPLSASRYLKTPTIFGFQGIYRALARSLSIEENGRLGTKGFELLTIWARERGLDGFAGTGEGPGRSARRMLVDAVADGLKAGATARKSGWAGWDFFREHLNIRQIGPKEADFITTALNTDPIGFRPDVFKFLVSPAGRAAFENGSERDFYQALEKGAREEVRPLLAAMSVYELFARRCQDAFDDCLVEMTRKGRKTAPGELGRLDSVRLAAKQLPDMFGRIAESLEPFGLSARFCDAFASLADRCADAEWAGRLMEHHRKTQRLKPPDGKNPWFDRFDDGSMTVRSLYRRQEGGLHNDNFLHGYRAGSLWTFATDLKLIPV